jgi:hypothetical protein
MLLGDRGICRRVTVFSRASESYTGSVTVEPPADAAAGLLAGTQATVHTGTLTTLGESAKAGLRLAPSKRAPCKRSPPSRHGTAAPAILAAVPSARHSHASTSESTGTRDVAAVCCRKALKKTSGRKRSARSRGCAKRVTARARLSHSPRTVVCDPTARSHADASVQPAQDFSQLSGVSRRSKDWATFRISGVNNAVPFKTLQER